MRLRRRTNSQHYDRLNRLILLLLPALVAALLVSGPPAAADECTPNLRIYDAQGDVAVPDDDEETRGAFAVLNKNDSDGNGKSDLTQDDNLKEVDLIKLVMKEISGPSDLVLLNTTSEVKLWTNQKKGKLITPVEAGGTSYQFDEPRTLWAEGVKKSEEVADVSFEYVGTHTHPQPPPAPPPTPVPCGSDVARATIVWAEKTDLKSDGGLGGWGDFTNPPAKALDRRCGDGFGLRPIAPHPKGVANCIGIQFKITPQDVGQEAGVKIDITRQMLHRGWERKNENGKFAAIEKDTVNFPAGDDPNDDLNDPGVGEGPHEVDSSSKPTAAGHLYSIDGPGLTYEEANASENVQRFNMLEFVRIRFDGKGFHGTSVDGSRCSGKVEWHASHHVEKGPGGKWKRTGGNDENNVGPGHMDKIGVKPTD